MNRQKRLQLVTYLITLLVFIYATVNLGRKEANEKKLKLDIIKESIEFNSNDIDTEFSNSIDPKFNIYIENNYDSEFYFQLPVEDIDPKFNIYY